MIEEKTQSKKVSKRDRHNLVRVAGCRLVYNGSATIPQGRVQICFGHSKYKQINVA